MISNIAPYQKVGKQQSAYKKQMVSNRVHERKTRRYTTERCADWQVLAGTGRYWQVSNGACDTTMMTSNRKFTERETVMISNNRAHGRIHIASKIAHSTKQQQDMCKQQRKISHRAYGWNRAPSGKQHPGD